MRGWRRLKRWLRGWSWLWRDWSSIGDYPAGRWRLRAMRWLTALSAVAVIGAVCTANFPGSQSNLIAAGVAIWILGMALFWRPPPK
jgi:hypothetical protein